MSTGHSSDKGSRDANESDAERSVRDLMGLLVLPSLWAGRDGQTILQIMTEAVERIVTPLCFTYTQAISLPDHPLLTRLRVRRQEVPDHELQTWQACIVAWSAKHGLNGSVFESGTPLGAMRIVRFSMGYTARSGYIWFGSSDPDFPSNAHLAFMRAATSLAASGLQTARISYEREQASRAKDEFLAMLGHELRNPLAPISAALDLIKLKNDGHLGDAMHIIERQVGHLSRLVDDLLDISRVTRGKVQLAKEALDLRLVLDEAVEGCSPLLNERQHRLTVHGPEQAVWIDGDATRLTQVFSNLLTNAAKYTEPGGEIDIAVEPNQETVSVSVRDNGLGISAQLFPRLFNIFEQGSSTIDRSRGGLGIGLALVKNFVELHGGRVHASSQGEGQGAEFTVVLPLLQNAGKAAWSKAAPPRSEKRFPGVRVLIVDDNADALNTMADLLREYGFEIAVAANPIEALALADQFQPKFALLDIGLPVMDGYQLAKKLRKCFSKESLQLIALSGYGQSSDRARSVEAGFSCHMVKPVNLAQLTAFIETNLAKTS